MDKPVKLDVLAVAAHPDDVEITCGGLLIKLAQKGKAVGVIDVTRGEMGTLGTHEDRIKEADAAARAMGLVYRGNMGLPDSAVEYTIENSRKLAVMIRQLKPELVILPHWEQRHPDHLAVSKIGYDACFFAGLKKLPIAGEPSRPRKVIYASYYEGENYSFLVDISEQIEAKCKAIACYHSQFGDFEASKQVFHYSGQDIYTLMRTRCADLGYRVAVNFAEAYFIKEDILIDDPLLMPVKSI
jgi:bacillithiol biosynthesis deacetylase BshB1